MQYTFQCGDEFIRLKIDRLNKKLEMASSKTAYRFYPIPYSELFGIKDTPEQTQLQKEMESKSDKEFEEYLVKEFLQKGYILAKKGKEFINQKEYYKGKNITITTITKDRSCKDIQQFDSFRGVRLDIFYDIYKDG